MRLPESITALLRRQNGTITSRDIAGAGISRTMLGRYVANGLLEHSSRGVYSATDKIPDELFALSRRCDRIVFSHTTAAFLLGIAERTPFDHTVSVRTSQTIPTALRAEVKCFYVKDAFYGLGLTTARTQFGNTVPCYNLERTVCDLIRYRSRIDEETFLATMKNYFRLQQKDLRRLGSYAETLKIAKRVHAIAELMQ